MADQEESDSRYARLLQRYPVGNLSPAQLEDWVAMVLRSIGSEEGVSDLRVQVHERIDGVDGTFDLDATVRFRALGLDFLALVEVKQHRHPIKRDLVQVLHSKVQSVGGQKGIMFSTSHYQSGALEYAKVHGIALVFVTEGRLTIERRSQHEVPPLSAEEAQEWGIEHIVGTYFGRGDDAQVNLPRVARRIPGIVATHPNLLEVAVRSVSSGQPGRQPMTEKRELYVRLIHQGVSNSAACRSLGIDRKTGHWWKNGGVVVRNGVTRIVAPLVVQAPPKPDSGRYLSEDERVAIADGDRAGRSARAIASELGRAVSTVSRELKRNAPADGRSYRPHAAHATMLTRRPRPRQRRLEVDVELRHVVQGYLDQRWSPEQTARAVRHDHGTTISAETIYQALYSPQRVLQRDPRVMLRTHRPHRRPHRRGDERRARFVVPMRMIEDRSDEADDRNVAGHWEGDLIIGAFNRSAIGTLVERSTRFTILVHLGEGSRAHNLRDQLTEIFNQLPAGLRRSLTWDQGVEMCHHHEIADATRMPVFFCHRGSPWQRPSNENTNGLLRDYFPKGTNLRVHSAADLAGVSDELNRRPRKVLDWQTPQALFTTLRTSSV